MSAQLIYRSLSNYSSTLYLNLYHQHFSYIKDLKKYTKSFCLFRCGKFWKRARNLRQHERKCEAKVHFTFARGVYNSPPTIFQLLEDEGFTIPQQLKYFPYRATFDFECTFNRNPGLKNTKKLNWHAKHVPLSVCVCSNVPNFTETKSFVSEGDSTQLVRDMVNYLVEISKEGCRLMKQEFASLFKAIDDRLEKREKESRVDEEDSDDEGEDIVDTDGEEELIESENEEDRVFLNEEVEDEQGPSFYRALDQKHR